MKINLKGTYKGDKIIEAFKNMNTNFFPDTKWEHRESASFDSIRGSIDPPKLIKRERVMITFHFLIRRCGIFSKILSEWKRPDFVWVWIPGIYPDKHYTRIGIDFDVSNLRKYLRIDYEDIRCSFITKFLSEFYAQLSKI